MITYICGDIFSSKSQVLVNPVNCIGVMGAGLALNFKQQYPDMFSHYQTMCSENRIKPGCLWLYHSSPWILCFPTKRHWRDRSRIEWIDVGLRNFIKIYKEKGIESIAFPKLGCGLGGLNFDRDVKPLMEHYLSDPPISIEIYK